MHTKPSQILPSQPPPLWNIPKGTVPPPPARPPGVRRRPWDRWRGGGSRSTQSPPGPCVGGGALCDMGEREAAALDASQLTGASTPGQPPPPPRRSLEGRGGGAYLPSLALREPHHHVPGVSTDPSMASFLLWLNCGSALESQSPLGLLSRPALEKIGGRSGCLSGATVPRAFVYGRRPIPVPPCGQFDCPRGRPWMAPPPSTSGSLQVAAPTPHTDPRGRSAVKKGRDPRKGEPDTHAAPFVPLCRWSPPRPPLCLAARLTPDWTLSMPTRDSNAVWAVKHGR